MKKTVTIAVLAVVRAPYRNARCQEQASRKKKNNCFTVLLCRMCAQEWCSHSPLHKDQVLPDYFVVLVTVADSQYKPCAKIDQFFLRSHTVITFSSRLFGRYHFCVVFLFYRVYYLPVVISPGNLGQIAKTVCCGLLVNASSPNSISQKHQRRLVSPRDIIKIRVSRSIQITIEISFLLEISAVQTGCIARLGLFSQHLSANCLFAHFLYLKQTIHHLLFGQRFFTPSVIAVSSLFSRKSPV